MDRLFAKLGWPPYQLEHVTRLRDECQALTGAIKAGRAVEKDNALEMFNMMEQMTHLIVFDSRKVFPQIAEFRTRQPGSGTETADDQPLASQGSLELFAAETLQYRDVLLGFLKLPDNSGGVCEQCNWTFERMLRSQKPPKGRRNLTIQGFDSSKGLGQFLLAQYDLTKKLDRTGVSAACKSCCFAWEQVAQVQHESDVSRSFTVWIRPHWAPYDNRRLEFVNLRAFSSSGEETVDMSFTVETSDESLAREFSLFGSPSNSTLSPSNLKFIRGHLMKSEAPHSSTHYLPKRLIDLGLDPATVPRLVEPEHGTDDTLKYATLSYCWGPLAEAEKQLKLTRANRDEFRKAIPLDEMTTVLQEAVLVCRILRIRHIWIDSLCIIQGEEEHSDWEEQSYEMNRIFGNSWLTICAVASSSCTRSFLHHIDRKSPMLSFNVYSQGLSALDGSLQLRLCTYNGKPTKIRKDLLASHLPLDRDLFTSEWNERGWVYQEKALSPRKLYFGARMVHFQGKDHVFSENGCTIPVRHLREPADDLWEYRQSFTPVSLRTQHPFIPDLWYQTAAANARLRFTNRLDLLPAISGVARVFAQATSYQYLAGLWTEDLHCGLLWSCSSFLDPLAPSHPASLPQLLRALDKSSTIAPSWSWVTASSRPVCRFVLTNRTNATCRVRTHLKPQFELHHTRAEIEGSNPLGRIKGASITLRGKTIPLPANSMPSVSQNTDIEPLRWVCKFGAASIMIITPDWNPVCATATGLNSRSQNRLRLLLVADCCTDQQNAAKHCKFCLCSFQRPAETTTTNGHREAQKLDECDRCKNLYAIQLQGMHKSRYRSTFFEDSSPGFDPATDCAFCADASFKRDIWGLLIFPAGDTDTYYRVGTFISRAEHGGSDIFHGAEEQVLTLV